MLVNGPFIYISVKKNRKKVGNYVSRGHDTIAIYSTVDAGKISVLLAPFVLENGTIFRFGTNFRMRPDLIRKITKIQ